GAAPFVAVHGPVGRPEERSDVRAVIRENTETDGYARVQGQIALGQPVRLHETLSELVRVLFCRSGTGDGQQEQELVPAEPGSVLPFDESTADAPAGCPEQLVTRHVPVLVVNLLE